MKRLDVQLSKYVQVFGVSFCLFRFKIRRVPKVKP